MNIKYSYKKSPEEVMADLENGLTSPDKVDASTWLHISKSAALSTAFIDKFAEHLDWKMVLCYHALSEEQIERHADIILWDEVSRYQHLSTEFIRKHKHQLNLNLIKMGATLGNGRLGSDFFAVIRKDGKADHIEKLTFIANTDDSVSGKMVVAFKGAEGEDSFTKDNFVKVPYKDCYNSRKYAEVFLEI